jgi:hypothetical protein
MTPWYVTRLSSDSQRLLQAVLRHIYVRNTEPFWRAAARLLELREDGVSARRYALMELTKAWRDRMFKDSTAFAIAFTHRLCTYYLAPIWGYASLQWLGRKGYV